MAKFVVGLKNAQLDKSEHHVEIPDGITSISSFAFSGCTSLASVEIPTSVKTISTCAFFNCRSLTDIYYKGEKEEFEAALAHPMCLYDVLVIFFLNIGSESLTIHCTDGNIKRR